MLKKKHKNVFFGGNQFDYMENIIARARNEMVEISLYFCQAGYSKKEGGEWVGLKSTGTVCSLFNCSDSSDLRMDEVLTIYFFQKQTSSVET